MGTAALVPLVGDANLAAPLEYIELDVVTICTALLGEVLPRFADAAVMLCLACFERLRGSREGFPPSVKEPDPIDIDCDPHIGLGLLAATGDDTVAEAEAEAEAEAWAGEDAEAEVEAEASFCAGFASRDGEDLDGPIGRGFKGEIGSGGCCGAVEAMVGVTSLRSGTCGNKSLTFLTHG